MMKINHCSNHTVNKVSITLIERTNQILDGITRSYDAQFSKQAEIGHATTSCRNDETLPRKKDLSCFKSLPVTGL